MNSVSLVASFLIIVQTIPPLDSSPERSLRSASELIERLFAERSPGSVSAQQKGATGVNQQYRLHARALLQSSRNAPLFFLDASKYGFPSTTGQLIFCNTYIVSCDRRLGQPVWVLEHLTSEKIERYGYHRTNLPSANKYINYKLKDPSVCSSNVTPQLPALNLGPWMILEKYVEHIARHSRNIYIMTGTLYWPDADKEVSNQRRDFVTIELSRQGLIQQPTQFYKVFVYEDRRGLRSMEAFVLPNSEENNDHSNLNEFRIDIEHELRGIERSAGLPFFHKLDRSLIDKPHSLQFGFGGELESESTDSASSSSTTDTIELSIG